MFKAYFGSALPFELALSKEGVAARITKAFGGQDVTIGDAAFDAAVRVKTSTVEATSTFSRMRSAGRQCSLRCRRTRQPWSAAHTSSCAGRAG
jgi:hypothetical protein